MKTLRELRRYWREVLLGFLFVLPFATLPVFGWVWLLQHGLLYYWLGSVLAVTALILAVRAFWQPRPDVIVRPADPGAAPAEKNARDALQRLANRVTTTDLDNPDSVKRLLVSAVDVVANAYSPDNNTAILNFTLPEVLLMSEDISQRLRASIMNDVPLLRHVNIGWIIRGYEEIKTVKPFWNVWRVVRLTNPITALMQETRSFFINKGFVDAKGKVAAVLVREVGEVAIRLYSGAYRRRPDELFPTAPRPIVMKPLGPLTFLIAGQANTGKSSLLNALLGKVKAPVGLTQPTKKFIAYELQDDKAETLILVDSPGVDSLPSKRWLEQAREADLILWVTAANRADRAADQHALAALRTQTDLCLRPIPIVLIATHADKLNPPLEWSPPYDLTGDRPKEQNMRAALKAAGDALSFPSLKRALVVVGNCSDGAWNLEDIWRLIHNALPEAEQKQLERGSRPEGWLKVTFDSIISVLGAAEVIKRFLA